MKASNDLGRDPIIGLVARLAIPAMVAQVVNVLYSIIDRMFIGNIPEIGGMALAGVGVCGPIVTLLSSFGILIGLGGSILMAMRMGAKETAEARRLLANSAVMLAVVSLLLTVIFLCSKGFLIRSFGASPSIFGYADTYLTIYTLGSFFALMAVGLNYFITCQGFALVGMVTVLIGAVTNIVLDAVFIIGLGWGVAGAACATVIAQMLSCFFAIGVLRSKMMPVRITFGGYDFRIWRQIATIGLPTFFIWASDSVILIVMNASLQHYGGAQGDVFISAVTIAQSYFFLITGPLGGLTSGTQAVLSYNYGGRAVGRIRQALKVILTFGLILTTGMFFVTRWVAPLFARAFTPDVEIQGLAIWAMGVFTLAVIPLTFQYVLVDGLTALGRVWTAFSLAFIRKGTYVLCVVALPITWGVRSAFYAEPISDVVSCCVSTVVFLLIFPRLCRRMTSREPGFL